MIVVEVFRGAGHSVSRVGHDDIDPPKVVERLVDDAADGRGVGDVEGSPPEPIPEAGRQGVEMFGPPNGRRDGVTAHQQGLHEFAPHPAGCPGDEPGLSHDVPSNPPSTFQGKMGSSRTRTPTAS